MIKYLQGVEVSDEVYSMKGERYFNRVENIEKEESRHPLSLLTGKILLS